MKPVWLALAPLALACGAAAWASGEPNNFNQEHCAELHGDSWTWNDLECSVKLPSVCESPAKSRPPE